MLDHRIRIECVYPLECKERRRDENAFDVSFFFVAFICIDELKTLYIRPHNRWNMAWNELLFSIHLLVVVLSMLCYVIYIHIFLSFFLHSLFDTDLWEQMYELSYKTSICVWIFFYIKLSNQFNQCAEGNPLPYRFKYMYKKTSVFFIFVSISKKIGVFSSSFCSHRVFFIFIFPLLYFLFCLFRLSWFPFRVRVIFFFSSLFVCCILRVCVFKYICV